MQGRFVRGVSDILYCSSDCAWEAGDQVTKYESQGSIKIHELGQKCPGCNETFSKFLTAKPAPKAVPKRHRTANAASDELDEL
jgi:hypothetical protein